MLLDENGKPDEEHEPTAINRLIRSILHSFSHAAYVGYTATPFANIFIHEQGRTREEGADLFPDSFIINLAAPSNYVGPAKVFGSRSENGRSGGLPLVRPVADFEAVDADGPQERPPAPSRRKERASSVAERGHRRFPPCLCACAGCGARKRSTARCSSMSPASPRCSARCMRRSRSACDT